MKKNFTILMMLVLFAIGKGYGQDCDDNVLLSSQAEVNAFNRTEIAGTLSIRGADIVDLTPLQSLTKVSRLYISDNPNLTNVDGLSGLQTITGKCHAFLTEVIGIYGNPLLKNLDGLSGLTMDTLPATTITNNASLETINAFSSATKAFGLFYIENNPMLKSFNGFRNIKTLETGSFEPFFSISGNASLENVDGLASLQSISGRFAGLNISNNPQLKNIDGLASLQYVSGGGRGAGIAIESNAELTNIDGLSGFKALGYGAGGSFVIRNNAKLLNLNGLKDFRPELGPVVFNISKNSSLTDCSALYGAFLSYGLISVRNAFVLSENGAGCTIDDILAMGPPAISQFRLTNRVTGQTGGLYHDYEIISSNTYDLEALPYGTVKSVVFTNGNKTFVDNEAPFTVGPEFLEVGLNTITVEPYSLPDKQGIKGLTRIASIEFELYSFINSFELTDTSGKLIRRLNSDDKLNIGEASFRSFNIVAEYVGEQATHLKFWLNGVLVSTEKVTPYALAGDPGNGTLYAWKPKPGKYTLRAVPYVSFENKEYPGRGWEVTFEVYDTPTLGITSFDLVDTSGKVIRTLQPDDKINIAVDPYKSFTVVANTFGNVESVKFKVDRKAVVENVAPYTVTGDYNGVFNPLKLSVGKHTISATAYEADGAQSFSGREVATTFTIVNEPPIVVTGFSLVDTSGKIIKSLDESSTINIADPRFKAFTIVANTTGKIGSVKIKLDQSTIVENVAPYTATGDNSVVFNSWKANVGRHTVSATPYANPGGQGATGNEVKVNFQVVHEPVASANLQVSLYPVPLKDNLHVQLKDATGNFSITLKNSHGHTLHQGTFVCGQQQGYTINTASLSQGVYFLVVRGSHGFEKVIRVIK